MIFRLWASLIVKNFKKVFCLVVLIFLTKMLSLFCGGLILAKVLLFLSLEPQLKLHAWRIFLIIIIIFFELVRWIVGITCRIQRISLVCYIQLFLLRFLLLPFWYQTLHLLLGFLRTFYKTLMFIWIDSLRKL